jgi:ATP-binding cassette, subfamily B, bacterial
MISIVFQRTRESIVNLGRVLKLVWASSRGWTMASIVLVLLQGLTPIAILYLTGAMIDAVTGVITNGGVGLENVMSYVILLAGVTLMSIALTTLGGLVSEGQTLSVADYVQSQIHARSIGVDLEYYESPGYYDHLHRAQQEAPYRPPQIVGSLLRSLSDGFTLIGVIALLLWINPATPILLFVSAIPAVIARMYFARATFAWKQRSASTERRAHYLSLLMTYESFAKEVRLFNTGDLFKGRFDALRARLRRERLGLASRQVAVELVIQTLSVAALFVAFYLVIGDTLRGALTLGSLVIAFQAFQRGQAVFQSLVGNLASLYENNLFLRDLYSFLLLEMHITSAAQPKAVPQPMREGIRFEDVAFRYAQGSSDVLHNVDLTIKPGEVVALVGENGAGKTTLIKLLCRLYDPSAGRITLDGTDLRDYDLVDLRRAITVMFQDYNQYQMYAWENIWLGNIERGTERPPIEAAAEASGADAVIRALPQGYDTQLGNYFGGQELSIGQWQKVALARAFMRDTQLVVLDEPTSALDVMAEHEVFERFRQIIAGKSAILISHRLSTIRMADRIYVLDGGCIAENGSHDELMARGGLYAKLFTTQSKYYR